MNIHIDATGGLVSNPRERETRGSRGRTATPLYFKAATSSLGDRHTANRDKGQLNNRKLMDPSIGKLTYFSLDRTVPRAGTLHHLSSLDPQYYLDLE